MPAPTLSRDWTLTRLVAGGAGVYAAVGGAVTLLGWILNVPRLAAWNGHGINMKANTAVCALAGGGALVALALGGPRRLVRALASMVFVVGALTLVEHVTGLDLGIDTLLFDEAPGAPATAAPGRMGPPAATSFSVIAVVLWLAGGGPRMRRAASGLALIAVAIAALGTVGYAFGVSELFAVARFTGIALQTATILAALGVGSMAAVPEHGLVASLRHDDPGGVLLRRLIAPLIFLPVVLGFLRLLGERAGFYDTAFGTAARTLIEAALLIGVTWWTADGVSRQARAARQAEEAMREATRHREESARRLAILAEASRVFSAASPELARVTEAVGSQVATVFGGSCSLLLVSVSGDTLEPVFVFHEDDRDPRRARRDAPSRARAHRRGRLGAGRPDGRGRAARGRRPAARVPDEARVRRLPGSPSDPEPPHRPAARRRQGDRRARHRALRGRAPVHRG